MTNGPGHIELGRTLDSIRVGRRHREDLGDIDALAASIEENGILQIITVDVDGNLVCGLRRLAAMRKLGMKKTDVWVRPGITDRLSELLAEQDDNLLHKPLTLTEQAALYREYKALLAEDAVRRQEATRFAGGGRNPRANGGIAGAPDRGMSGGATVAPPSNGAGDRGGRSREQAALLVAGRNSYTTLERVSRLQLLAADETQPETVRARAIAELAGIDQGGSVTAAHQRTRAEVSLAELDQLADDPSAPETVRTQAARDVAMLRAAEARERAADLERLAAGALARVRETGKRPRRPHAVPAKAAGAMSVRAFVLTWDDLAGWWERCDPAELGPALTEEQWERFEATVAGTLAFVDLARTAREQTDQAG